MTAISLSHASSNTAKWIPQIYLHFGYKVNLGKDYCWLSQGRSKRNMMGILGAIKLKVDRGLGGCFKDSGVLDFLAMTTPDYICALLSDSLALVADRPIGLVSPQAHRSINPSAHWLLSPSGPIGPIDLSRCGKVCSGYRNLTHILVSERATWGK